MNDLFEKNLKSIEANRRFLWESIQDDIPRFRESPNGNHEESFEWVNKPNTATNLFYKRKEDAFEGLLHSDQPAKEAQQIFKQADLSFPQFVIFFAPGLGHLLQLFYKDRPIHNYAITVVEKNPQIFLRSLCLYDFTEIFEDETVHWIVGFKADKVKMLFSHLLQQYSTVSRSVKILASPTGLELDHEYYREIAETILRTRDETVYAVGNSTADSFIGFQNIGANVLRALENPGADLLIQAKEKFKGKTILSVAAGPQTDDHWEEIKALQGRVPIITCDVMLRPMLKRGIIPDFITAVERVIEVLPYFKDVSIPERTRLVGPLLLKPEVLEAYRGEQILYCPTAQQGRGLGLSFLGAFFPGPSSGNLNIYFAGALGFENVIMVGHNLAFGYDKLVSHIHGTGVEEQDREKTPEELAREKSVPTQDGLSEVKTTIFWNSFRHQMQETITLYERTNFINTAAKGAKIEGALYMSLSEAVQKYIKEDFDIDPVVRELLKPVSNEIRNERQEVVLAHLDKAIECLEKWSSEGIRILKRIQKWKDEIKVREAEAKPVSLDFLNKRLDEVLELKVAAINHDKYFFNFAAVTFLPVHVTFEREINELPSKYTSNYELKRDFLLRHEEYFEIWAKWLPQFLDELYKTKKRLRVD